MPLATSFTPLTTTYSRLATYLLSLYSHCLLPIRALHTLLRSTYFSLCLLLTLPTTYYLHYLRLTLPIAHLLCKSALLNDKGVKIQLLLCPLDDLLLKRQAVPYVQVALVLYARSARGGLGGMLRHGHRLAAGGGLGVWWHVVACRLATAILREGPLGKVKWLSHHTGWLHSADT